MGVFWGVYMYFQYDFIFLEGNIKQFVFIIGKLLEEMLIFENQ